MSPSSEEEEEDELEEEESVRLQCQGGSSAVLLQRQTWLRHLALTCG